MYGKIFDSMFDGTLASRGPWQALVTFQQLIVLANRDGAVDMTADAISRRTSIPLEIIELGLAELMKPDPRSRTPDEDGRRIVLLDDHRDWGWQIVNHAKYQALRSAAERREYLRQAQADRRARLKSEAASTPVNNVNTVSKEIIMSTPTPTDIPATTTTKEKEKTPRTRAPASPAVTVDALCLDGLSEDLAIEWLAHRKGKRATLTPRAWQELKAEVAKTDLSLDDAIAKALARGWTGFEASWLRGDRNAQAAPPEPAFVTERREKIHAMTGGRMGGGLQPIGEIVDVDATRLD